MCETMGDSYFHILIALEKTKSLHLAGLDDFMSDTFKLQAATAKLSFYHNADLLSTGGWTQTQTQTPQKFILKDIKSITIYLYFIIYIFTCFVCKISI